MPDLLLQLAPEHQSKSKEELSILFDQEVDRFSRYMATMGDWKAAGPLLPLERVLIKTYLVQKYTGKLDV